MENQDYAVVVLFCFVWRGRGGSVGGVRLRWLVVTEAAQLRYRAGYNDVLRMPQYRHSMLLGDKSNDKVSVQGPIGRLGRHEYI